MSLEDNIERIADALEALVTLKQGGADTPENPFSFMKSFDAQPPASRGKAEGPAPETVQANVPDVGQGTTEAVQLDAAGLPWDERIHSSNGKLTAKGVWQARRNVDPTYRAQVEAELRGDGQPTSPSDASIPQGGETTPATTPATGEVPTNITAETLKQLATDLVRTLGPDAVKVQSLLQDYGVAKLSDLVPEQYAGFYNGLMALKQGLGQ